MLCAALSFRLLLRETTATGEGAGATCAWVDLNALTTMAMWHSRPRLWLLNRLTLGVARDTIPSQIMKIQFHVLKHRGGSCKRVDDPSLEESIFWVRTHHG